MFKFLSKTGLLIAAALFGVSALVAVPAHANTGRKTEDVEAAIVFNILRFASFPGIDVPTLCVLPGTELSSSLLAIDGKAAGRQILVTRELAPGTPAAEIAQKCSALFVPMTADNPASYAATNVLTIGKSPDFTQQGGIVRLFTFGRQTRFEINMTAAQKAGVSFSSKLLRLARIYRGG